MDVTDSLEAGINKIFISECHSQQTPIEDETDDRLTILEVLPWEDVLVARILPYLDIWDLFQLRQVSTGFRDVVSLHYAECRILDLSKVGPHFSVEAFGVVTKEAKNLVSLNVSCCKKWITDAVLLPVIRNNKYLREINVSGNSSLSTEVVRTISVTCPELCSLSLAECQQVTSSSVKSIAMNCEKLEHLDLTGCWDMDDDSIYLLLQLHPLLKWLSVARAYGITDVLIGEIPYFCPDIEYLDIQGCWRVTDEAVCKLWALQMLRTFRVKDCRYITEKSLARFRARGVQMDVLLPEESDLAKLERHLRAREFARTRSIPPNFVL